jgi:hypothetical protein
VRLLPHVYLGFCLLQCPDTMEESLVTKLIALLGICVLFIPLPQLLATRQIFTIKFVDLNQIFVSSRFYLVTPWSKALLEKILGPQPGNSSHFMESKFLCRVHKGSEERI